MPSDDIECTDEGSTDETVHEKWRSRITRSGVVKTEDVLPNPMNWREHPEFQEDILARVLDRVGWVQQIVINERSGNLIDGHLRVAIAEKRNEKELPAVFVDLDDEEERLVLSTLDPITSLATTEHERLREIINELQLDDNILKSFLDSLVPLEDTVSPSEFPSVDEALSTDYRCPKCGYEWSGSPR